MLSRTGLVEVVFALVASCKEAFAFQTTSNGWRVSHCPSRTHRFAASSQQDNPISSNSEQDDVLDATNRLPTSVEDQVRQAALSLQRASADGRHRHNIRLLLPVIGATDLDDWPGGARQMMEAAYPLVTSILKGFNEVVKFDEMLLDASDGVYAVLAQAKSAKNDSCAVLLPTADLVPKLKEMETLQVGPSRDFILVNAQWKRRSDFGGQGWFGGNAGKENSRYIETVYEPTFSLTNLIVEGEVIRVLRTYPGPWRVFVRKEEEGVVDWVQVGQKEFEPLKPQSWEEQESNKRDGGLLFNFGLPTYQEIDAMVKNSPNYTPLNSAERAMAAFNFIKDTL